jgi:sugar phosphate isomerase/epimerase
MKLGAAGALATVMNASVKADSSARQGMRLGGPVFVKTEDPAELAKEHRRLGYGAAYCPEFASLSDLNAVREIERSFAAENVIIAEVGAWRNMLDPDEANRSANLEYVVERCALADEIGARCCVDIAGSYNKDSWYGPDPRNLSREFFERTVENCRHILDHVKPKRTRFTIEMMGWNLPDGPDAYLDLVKAVDRTAFAVHLDVCNGINSPRRFYENPAFIRECFKKLGPWIVSCHGKDLQWIIEYNVRFKEVAPGSGQIDYGVYLEEIAHLDADIPLMLEHMTTEAEYDDGRKFIQALAAKKGIALNSNARQLAGSA